MTYDRSPEFPVGGIPRANEEAFGQRAEGRSVGRLDRVFGLAGLSRPAVLCPGGPAKKLAPPVIGATTVSGSGDDHHSPLAIVRARAGTVVYHARRPAGRLC